MKKNPTKEPSQAEKYLRRYLSVAPLALALWRSIEAKHFGKVELKRPILDIGCGFGEFAGVFFESQVEVGVDIDYRELVNAMKGNKYMSLSRADARNLPFADQSFSSVVSISTLEHIIGVDKVLKEAFRVLKPGGMLAVTVVMDKLDDSTFYGPTLKKIGLTKLGEFYVKIYNKVFHHHTMLSKKQWEKQVANAGFNIKVSKEIISPKVTRIFDLLLVAAWPSQLIKLAIGRRIAIGPRFMLNFFTKLLLPLVEEEETEGTNLLIVATKTAGGKASIGRRPRK